MSKPTGYIELSSYVATKIENEHTDGDADADTSDKGYSICDVQIAVIHRLQHLVPQH